MGLRPKARQKKGRWKWWRELGDGERQKRKKKTEVLIIFMKDLSFSLFSTSGAHHSPSQFDVSHYILQ